MLVLYQRCLSCPPLACGLCPYNVCFHGAAVLRVSEIQLSLVSAALPFVWAWNVIARPCAPGLALVQGPPSAFHCGSALHLELMFVKELGLCLDPFFPHLKNLTFQKIFKPIQADYYSEPECTRSPPSARDWLPPSSASVFTARKHRLFAASSGQTGVPV